MRVILSWGIGTVIVLFLLYLVLRKFGLVGPETKGDPELKEKVKETLLAPDTMIESKWFDPKTWMQIAGTSYSLLNGNEAKILAKDIYDSISWYGDDEERIYSVFRKLKNKYQVSQLSYYFEELYQKDLAGVLVDNLSNTELSFILIIIEKTPNL